MLPGPDLILKLPKSKSLVRISTINSGNTFRAVRWSDAYTYTPMLPEEPPLRVHPATGEIFLVSRCKEVAEVISGEKDDWKQVPYADNPTAEYYIRALDEGLARDARESRMFRICLWWLHNHPVRENGQMTAPPEEFRTNLTALLELIQSNEDLSDNDRLLAAEIHRELGQFDEAEALLSVPFNDPLKEIAIQILEWIKLRDHLVRKF
jgi:hypothetical protein